jgi:hypothetical protein
MDVLAQCVASVGREGEAGLDEALTAGCLGVFEGQRREVFAMATFGELAQALAVEVYTIHFTKYVIQYALLHCTLYSTPYTIIQSTMHHTLSLHIRGRQERSWGGWAGTCSTLSSLAWTTRSPGSGAPPRSSSRPSVRSARHHKRYSLTP